MHLLTPIVLAAVIGLCPRAVIAQVHIEAAGKQLPDAALRHIDTATAEIADPSDARAILQETLFKADGGAGASLDADDVYCIVHVMKWATSDIKPAVAGADDRKTQASPVQRWYVYHAGKWSQDDFATRFRVFGVKRLWLVFIHLDRPPAEYVSRYQFSIAAKLPAPVGHLSDLATFFFKSTDGGAPAGDAHRWGGGSVEIHSVPSDITIQPIRVNASRSGNAYEKLGDAKVFDNEGHYRWDFSIGVPIKAGKELQVNAAAATAAPVKVDKQNIFALLNLFPQPVDVKSAGLWRVPHLVAGFAISDKPQDKLLLAGGWGPAFANFYLGTLFVKQPIADAEGNRWDRQLAFGVNLTVKGTLKALEPAK